MGSSELRVVVDPAPGLFLRHRRGRDGEAAGLDSREPAAIIEKARRVFEGRGRHG